MCFGHGKTHTSPFQKAGYHMKRILTIQDISCIGKCSITVALPIISAAGTEVAVLPTALLSAHTMFEGFTVKDLTDQIEPICSHWKKEGFRFDGIYTGYLANESQITAVKKVIADFRNEQSLVVVDPAMADNGKLYPGLDMGFAEKMRSLCAEADIILPNVTEAAILTGTPIRQEYEADYIDLLLEKLSALGAKICAVTGVDFGSGVTGVCALHCGEKNRFEHRQPKLACSYPGTGDVFASTFMGAMMRGLSWTKALEIAAVFTARCIELTMADGKDQWYSVHFEQAIPFLLELMEKP